MANVLKSLGNIIKTGAGKVLGGLDNLAKNASQSGNLLSSAIGSVVDALIPDDLKERMVGAAARDNVTKTAEVEKTVTSLAISQGIDNPTVIAEATKQLTGAIADESKTGITNEGSSVKVGILTRLVALLNKYKYVSLAVGAAAVYYFGFNRNGKKVLRKYIKF